MGYPPEIYKWRQITILVLLGSIAVKVQVGNPGADHRAGAQEGEDALADCRHSGVGRMLMLVYVNETLGSVYTGGAV